MANKKNALVIMVIALLVLLVGVTILLFTEKKTNSELVQEFQLERKTWKTNTPDLHSNTTN